jgi:hypothetical protein
MALSLYTSESVGAIAHSVSLFRSPLLISPSTLPIFLFLSFFSFYPSLSPSLSFPLSHNFSISLFLSLSLSLYPSLYIYISLSLYLSIYHHLSYPLSISLSHTSTLDKTHLFSVVLSHCKSHNIQCTKSIGQWTRLIEQLRYPGSRNRDAYFTHAQSR